MNHFDLYGIGNALVDVETRVTNQFLNDNNVVKGCMTLVEAARQNELLDQLRQKIEHKSCGGSLANSTIATANFGSKCYYSCQVADDEMGRFFHRDLMHQTIQSNLDDEPLPKGDTGTCLAMITPDADRTMNTFLGIGGQVGPKQVNLDVAKNARISFLEGYLISSECGKEALHHIAQQSSQNGKICALSMSDPMLVKFFREEFLALIKGGVSLLFMNEDEAMELTQAEDLKHAISWLKQHTKQFVVTCGSKGSLSWDGSNLFETPVPTINQLDTIGAGDMFAGSFLYALLQDASFDTAATIACYCASLVVGQYGSRLEAQNQVKANQFVKNILHSQFA
jgi:sugar/nucleoside kinase (ribokinase family)